MVKEESMMFVPKATPGAQKILEEYLRKNKLEAHQLSPEQRNELQQILLAEGITSEKIAEETLKVRFCPIAEPMGGKLEFFSDHAMVTFVDEDDPMRINFIDNGLTRDAKNPGIADLRWKLCELEKQSNMARISRVIPFGMHIGIPRMLYAASTGTSRLS